MNAKPTHSVRVKVDPKSDPVLSICISLRDKVLDDYLLLYDQVHIASTTLHVSSAGFTDI